MPSTTDRKWSEAIVSQRWLSQRSELAMTEDERVADKAALLYLLLQEVQVSFVLAKNKQKT